jgi:ribosomal protein S17E
MMKVNMSKTEFKELLEEYISNLEKDYDSNQKENRNHPIFSLIQNTYQKLKDKYYYRKLGFTLTFFLFCIIYLAITIVFPSLPLAFFIVSPFLILLILYLVVTKLIKTPDLVDITSLGDRILLVREKIKNFDFDYFVVKEMIIDIDKIYHLERLAYLKKYYELMKPTFDGNKNKNTNYESNPVERLIAIDQIIETTKIPIQNEERALLLSSILRISDSDFPNVKTSLNVINKIKNKEELKDSEIKKIDIIKESLRNTITILQVATKNTENLFSTLDKTT